MKWFPALLVLAVAVFAMAVAVRERHLSDLSIKQMEYSQICAGTFKINPQLYVVEVPPT